jgi:dUTP pyrophosphatase
MLRYFLLKYKNIISMKINVKIKKLDHFPKNTNLSYATEFSSGIDLIASIDEKIILKKSQRILIPTGISIEMPRGYEAQIRSRSGLAWKNGVIVLNSPGTIDNDYRGEIKIILMNFGEEDFIIEPKMRIAQMIFAQFIQANLNEDDDLEDTNRSDGGFGSTGTH